MHGELQAEFVQPHAGTWPFAVERERHLRGVRQVKRQMIRALRADARSGREHALRRLAKRDGNDPLTLRKSLSGTEVERYACPTPIVDGALQGNEGVGFR